MKLDAWTENANPADAARRKRLSVGYAVGALLITGSLFFLTLTAHGQVFEADETIDVALAPVPEAPADPEPVVEPEPPKVQKKKNPNKNKMSMSTPKDIPGGTPDEADPGKNNFDGDLDDAFDGEGGGGPAAPVKPAVIVKKKEPPPAPPAFSLVSERAESSPATPISQPPPAYPSAAKAEGVEGTVVVQFLVTTSGTVGDVRVVRGDSRLSAAVVDAVKRWRFNPATFRGRPVSTWRTASFPFRLKT